MRALAMMTILCAGACGSVPAATRDAATDEPDSADRGAVQTFVYTDPGTNSPNSVSLDVYPAAGEGRPVVLFFHGGSPRAADDLRAGDKTNVLMSQLPSYLEDRDIVLVSANFRRLGEVDTMDGAVSDAALATRWIEDNIAEHGGAPDQITIFGFSLGAYLAAKLGADESATNSAGVTRSSIKGVVALDTVMYDIPRAIARAEELGFPDSAINLPMIFGSDLAEQVAASPITTVDASGTYPPFLIPYVREKDGLTHDLTRDQSSVLADALVAAGGDASVIEGVGLNHITAMQVIGTPGHPLTDAFAELLD